VDRGLILSGTAGAGKSTVAAEIAGRLADIGASFASIDADTVAQFGPAPRRDREGLSFYDTLKCRNVPSLWENFREAGARHLVIAASIDSFSLRAHF
jgi:adenylylsulfate kinase-like enzyme